MATYWKYAGNSAGPRLLPARDIVERAFSRARGDFRVLNALIAAYVISAFAEPDERLADAPEKVVRVGIWKERRAE